MAAAAALSLPSAEDPPDHARPRPSGLHLSTSLPYGLNDTMASSQSRGPSSPNPSAQDKEKMGVKPSLPLEINMPSHAHEKEKRGGQPLWTQPAAAPPLPPPLFVSKFQKSEEELAAEEEERGPRLVDNYNPEEKKRYLRWVYLNRFYRRINAKASAPPPAACASTPAPSAKQHPPTDPAVPVVPPPVEVADHACGSVENALWTLHKVVRRTEFVCCLMGEFRFPPSMHMDTLLHQLYSSFDGAEGDSVHIRDIIGSLHLLINHRTLRHSLLPIIARLYDIYCAPIAPFFPIKRPDLLQMLLLPLITDQDRARMGRLLDKIWPSGPPQVQLSISRMAFLSQCSKELQKAQFGWLGGQGGLLGLFQHAAWERVHTPLRLHVLTQAETILAERSAAIIDSHKERMAQRLRRKHVHAWVVSTWRVYSRLEGRIRGCRDRAVIRWARRGLRRWHADIVRVKKKRLDSVASNCLSEVYIKHRRLVSLQRHARLERHVRIAENRRKPVFRVVLDGMKHLRAAMDLKRQRDGWARWFAFAWDAAATQFAANHCAFHLQHKVIRALRVYVRNEVDRRKRWEFEEAERKKARDALQASVAEIAAVVAARERQRIEEEEQRRQEELDRLALERKWLAMRALAERQAQDRVKMESQHEQRQQRALEAQAKLRRDFDIQYDAMIEEQAERVRATVEEYFDYGYQVTELGREIVQPQFKVLKERFYRPPRIGEEGEEKDMADIANIVFVFIEVTLNQRELTLRELFEEFDTDGSGFMSHEEFTEFMKSLPVRLSGQNIRDIINKVDKDHDGAIGCEEIEAALRMATNKLGVPGSPWKMYVDPAQSVMCYHNVQTDEKVFDFKMTDPKLYQILHDNMVNYEPRKVRMGLQGKKQAALEHMVREYSANIIKRQARVWLARRWRRREYWRAALVLRAEKERATTEAVRIISDLALRFLARRQLRYLARLNYEKVVDISNPEQPLYYYFNHQTGASMWTRPSLLRGQRDADAVLPWSLHYHPVGRRPFFYHEPTRSTRPTKPDGWYGCARCRVNIAWKECDACGGVKLCFACFRGWHLRIPLARASRGDHHGRLLTCHYCTKCTEQKEAERSCKDCNTDYCRACHIRVHRSPLLAAHKFVPI